MRNFGNYALDKRNKPQYISGIMAAIVKYYWSLFLFALTGAWDKSQLVGAIIGLSIGAYIEIEQPNWGPKMKSPLLIIPLATFVGVFLARLFLAPYEKYKEQQKKISKLSAALKFKNTKQISIETEEQYSAALLDVAIEVKTILAVVGDKFYELLITKAAKYLVLQTIHKNNIYNEQAYYFVGKNVSPLSDFLRCLEGAFHKPELLTDKVIGKYCTVLFLIYDHCKPDRQLYGIVITEALDIAYKYAPDSPFCNLFCSGVEPQFLDTIKDCNNPPQNKTEIIGHIKGYLGSITAYLETEGFFKEEVI